jgi:hypothetical protein
MEAFNEEKTAKHDAEDEIELVPEDGEREEGFGNKKPQSVIQPL